MDNKKTAIHLVLLYLLLAAGALWLLSLSFTGDNETTDWACIQQECSQSSPAGEAWAAQNCGVVNQTDGSQVEACAVVIDGQQQIVARSAINLSAIQQCTQYSCVQEVRVRTVNYTLEQ